MKDVEDDPRLKAILQAAWSAFSTYGFRKTSMDDIARGAGMSRPALYLHFRNKEDIARRLIQIYYDQAAEAVGAALSGSGTVSEALAQAFAAQGGEIMEVMLTSPHGMEMVATGSTIAADIVQAGEQRLSDLYAAWLEVQAMSGRVTLNGPAGRIAQTMTTAMKGIKMSAPSYRVYREQLAQLAALIGAGLEAR